MKKLVAASACVFALATACAPDEEVEDRGSAAQALADDGAADLSSNPNELAAAMADEGVEAEGPDTDVDEEENAAWEEALADKSSGSFPMCSRRVGYTAADFEWNPCGPYQYRGRLFWDESTGDRVRLTKASISQYDGARREYVSGFDWQIWLKNDHGAIADSGYHTTPDNPTGSYAWFDLESFTPAKASHPYIRLLAGKNGDGRKSCLFRIYPCKKG